MKESIVIHLCGPLQSYGYKDYDRTRRTCQEPTSSAIAGIIACCGGIPRKDPGIDEIEKSFKIKRIRRLQTPGKIGEEKEKDSYYEILRDYQIVRPTEENPIFYANGKRSTSNLIEEKEYIMDAYFQVEIEGDRETIAKYKKWLQDPCWTPYLGRKCCVPSMPFIIEEKTECI